MKKIAVLGWAGHGNLGDELMLDGLKNLFKGCEFMVMSNDNRGTYPFIDFDAINSCDLCILGGGELIHADHLFMPTPSIFKAPSLMYRIYARTPLAHLPWTHRIKIPKIIFGCGVNAEGSSQLKLNVIEDLERFDYIGVRDNTSLNILKSFPRLKDKVFLSYDASFGIKIDRSWEAYDKVDRAIIIPTDRFTVGDEGVLERDIAVKSRDWLNEKLVSYKEKIFIAFGEIDNDDYETCKILSDKSSTILRSNNLLLQEILVMMGISKIVFPYRLHGLILSFITGTPYDFYPYHWKLQRVNDTIKDKKVEEIQNTQKAIADEIMEMIM